MIEKSFRHPLSVEIKNLMEDIKRLFSLLLDSSSTVKSIFQGNGENNSLYYKKLKFSLQNIS